VSIKERLLLVRDPLVTYDVKVSIFVKIRRCITSNEYHHHRSSTVNSLNQLSSSLAWQVIGLKPFVSERTEFYVLRGLLKTRSCRLIRFAHAAEGTSKQTCSPVVIFLVVIAVTNAPFATCHSYFLLVLV
jgi:hypothetical protein